MQVLKETLFHLKEVEGFDEHGVETTIVNPKSMSLSQLFGHSSQVSYKWTDGLITLTFRYVLHDTITIIHIHITTNTLHSYSGDSLRIMI